MTKRERLKKATAIRVDLEQKAQNASPFKGHRVEEHEAIALFKKLPSVADIYLSL